MTEGLVKQNTNYIVKLVYQGKQINNIYKANENLLFGIMSPVKKYINRLSRHQIIVIGLYMTILGKDKFLMQTFEEIL